MTTGALRHSPSNLIGGQWVSVAGDEIVSTMPAHPDRVVWSGTGSVGAVEAAMHAARSALGEWASWTMERRIEVLRSYQEIARARAVELGELISDETGKAMWESKAEAGLIAGKVDITIEEGIHSGRQRVSGFDFQLNETKNARCSFHPHGVMAVVGPFNFPAHLPNGHIVPALLMGNTVVFKPSEKTPAVGQMIAEMFDEALRMHEAPAGVVNLVHGAAEESRVLCGHHDVNGVLFTGSWDVGRKIQEANLDYPGKIVALEMGGNNPTIIMPDADIYQAVVEVVRCAFNTTGQRCTSTRRLIVHEAIADRVVTGVLKAASNLLVGDPRSANPVFMGPIISEQARNAVFAFEKRLAETGGRVLLESMGLPDHDGWYVTPSVVEVERFAMGTDDCGCDEELFGPLLRVCTVGSFDDALEQANATRYGLSASLFSADEEHQRAFLANAHAGCRNINCGTAGASSKLAFGGLGWSGNHRPAGAFSLDYCAYPVASMTETGDGCMIPTGMRVEWSWVD